ncbi:MAG: peptidylprolyl isomerase [Nocardioides sp.]|nr:peptidylprolyl isomerase [Nocardioides sp.]
MLKRPLAATAALVLLAGLTACSDDDGPTAAKDSSDGVACTYLEAAPAVKEVDLPPDHAAYDGEVDATIALSAGDVEVTLDAEAAPCTVNSFTSLAEQGYFDDTVCHRLTSSAFLQVLQCGDPSAMGSGGPGYSFEDELTGDETYGAGTLAMANAGPDTNGSQFFIVYGDSQLDPNYTVFGSVDSDTLGVVEDIAAEGVEGGFEDGSPATPVTIEGVTVD